MFLFVFVDREMRLFLFKWVSFFFRGRGRGGEGGWGGRVFICALKEDGGERVGRRGEGGKKEKKRGVSGSDPEVNIDPVVFIVNLQEKYIACCEWPGG